MECFLGLTRAIGRPRSRIELSSAAAATGIVTETDSVGDGDFLEGDDLSDGLGLGAFVIAA